MPIRVEVNFQFHWKCKQKSLYYLSLSFVYAAVLYCCGIGFANLDKPCQIEIYTSFHKSRHIGVTGTLNVHFNLCNFILCAIY